MKESVELLESINRGTSQEIDYPVHQILSLAESIVEKPDQAFELLASAARATDCWMALGQKRKRVQIRVRAPKAVGEKLPVLFLFHGAGGSENMFFETYGAGKYVRMGLERGYLVVATRAGLSGVSLEVPQMLDELEKLYSIDRDQVMVVGHSMGAGEVMRQAIASPDQIKAAVALGGGGRIRDAETVSGIKWFVAAGELDFGRRGAMALHRSLESDGVDSVYKDYSQVEHMVIVQAAAEDVFGFLNQLLQSDNR